MLISRKETLIIVFGIAVKLCHYQWNWNKVGRAYQRTHMWNCWTRRTEDDEIIRTAWTIVFVVESVETHWNGSTKHDKTVLPWEPNLLDNLICLKTSSSTCLFLGCATPVKELKRVEEYGFMNLTHVSVETVLWTETRFLSHRVFQRHARYLHSLLGGDIEDARVKRISRICWLAVHSMVIILSRPNIGLENNKPTETRANSSTTLDNKYKTRWPVWLRLRLFRVKQEHHPNSGRDACILKEDCFSIVEWPRC